MIQTKITIGIVLGWIFGVLFAFIALLALVTSDFIPGIITLILALIVLPPIQKILSNKFNLRIPIGLKIILLVVGVILFFVTISPTSNNSNSPLQINSQEVQENEIQTETKLVNKTPSSNNSSLQTNPQVAQESEKIQIDIKEALNEWSINLPTEYHLSDINTYCNKNQLAASECIDPSPINANAEQIAIIEAIAKSEGKSVPTKEIDSNSKICEKLQPVECSNIEESYTRAIGSSSFDSARGSIYRFKSKEVTKQHYDLVVNKIKEERGYTSIDVPPNCFGWEKDIVLVTQLQIVCYKLDVIYKIGFTDDPKVTEYARQLGDLLT